MNTHDAFTHVYSGTEIQVIVLRNLLEEVGVPVEVQNDFQAGVTAGFGGGTSSTIRVKIRTSDLEKARPVIEKFIADQEVDVKST